MPSKNMPGMLTKPIKTLYIHGLDAKPMPDKIQILEALNLDVAAMHIDYRENPDAYWILENYAQKNQTEYLIGSSFGGMYAYYLASKLKLPALLFNPALHSRSFEPELPKLTGTPDKPIYVVLGANDHIIPPNKTIQFFRENKIKNARIVSCHWLAHKIDLQTFEEMSRWAVSSLD